MKVAVFRKAHFNAAHRLHNAKWTDEKNQAVFGLCNNPNYAHDNWDYCTSRIPFDFFHLSILDCASGEQH